MTQRWHDVLFVHWPVDEERLRARVPPPLGLDRFEGQSWLGVVPFRMSHVAPRGMPPVPALSSFPELNVRTYVTVDGRPGVYFFSLDAARLIAVLGARVVFGLPYFMASMRVEVRPTPGGREVRYRSRRRWSRGSPAAFEARYRPTGPMRHPVPGSLEWFLTERYCLYVVNRRSQVRRLEIHHRPWPLQPAEAEVRVNTMASAAGIPLPDIAPLVHFGRRQDVIAWPMHAV
jgi:uncharacterized protein